MGHQCPRHPLPRHTHGPWTPRIYRNSFWLQTCILRSLISEVLIPLDLGPHFLIQKGHTLDPWNTFWPHGGQELVIPVSLEPGPILSSNCVPIFRVPYLFRTLSTDHFLFPVLSLLLTYSLTDLTQNFCDITKICTVENILWSSSRFCKFFKVYPYNVINYWLKKCFIPFPMPNPYVVIFLDTANSCC